MYIKKKDFYHEIIWQRSATDPRPEIPYRLDSRDFFPKDVNVLVFKAKTVPIGTDKVEDCLIAFDFENENIWYQNPYNMETHYCSKKAAYKYWRFYYDAYMDHLRLFKKAKRKENDTMPKWRPANLRTKKRTDK